MPFRTNTQFTNVKGLYQKALNEPIGIEDIVRAATSGKLATFPGADPEETFIQHMVKTNIFTPRDDGCYMSCSLTVSTRPSRRSLNCRTTEGHLYCSDNHCPIAVSHRQTPLDSLHEKHVGLLRDTLISETLCLDKHSLIPSRMNTVL